MCVDMSAPVGSSKLMESRGEISTLRDTMFLPLDDRALCIDTCLDVCLNVCLDTVHYNIPTANGPLLVRRYAHGHV